MLCLGLALMSAGALAEPIEPALGWADAPVTLIEYGSLTCDHCLEFHRKVLPELKRRYIDTGRVRFVFRDFPTSDKAARGALAARCVPEDDYYRMLDRLFWTAPEWSREPDVDAALTGQAMALGLRTPAFVRCLADRTRQQKLDDERRRLAKEEDMRGTPTFLINGRLVRGSRNVAELSSMIEAATHR
jgi:protein-disulfide isomerase